MVTAMIGKDPHEVSLECFQANTPHTAIPVTYRIRFHELCQLSFMVVVVKYVFQGHMQLDDLG